VLILHWVTSKDNASTHGSNSATASQVRRGVTPSRWDGSTNRKETVTTSIGRFDQEEPIVVPMHSIVVHTAHVQEVEIEQPTSIADGTMNKSTEDLVR
jgi:hypothetical protein